MSERRGSIGRARCRGRGLGSRVYEIFQQPSFPRRRESTAPQSSFPRRRESTVGAGDGFPSARERRAATAHPQSSARIHAPTIVIPATAGIHGEGWAMGSRLHGNDGRRRRVPTIVGENPRTRLHNRHSRDGGNPRGGRRWVPVCTGTTGDGGRTHNRRRESTAPQSSFPRRRESTARGAAMGSRLHGNDERRRAHPQSSARIHGPTIVIPATAGIHGGGRRWVPVCTGTTGGDGAPTIVIPTTAGIHGSHNRHSRDGGNPRGGAAMGSRLHGNDGRRRRTHNRRRESTHPQPSFPRRRESTARGGDGFPSARERREAAGAPTIVIPATAGIHGEGGDGFPSARERRAATAHPTIVIPTTAGIHGSHNRHSRDGGNPRTHNRHSRDGGNPRGGAGDGFPSARERRRRRRTHNRRRESTAQQPSFSRRRESTARGGDGFPSARERRAAAAYPQSSARIHGPTIVIPAKAGIHGGPAMGSRLHGNDGRRRAHPQTSFP